jgi:4-hydroxybenzoate polyprenyltransferase
LPVFGFQIITKDDGNGNSLMMESMENNSTKPSSRALPVLKHFCEMLDMIKFEHTVFALPFAFIGAMGAMSGSVPWLKFFWILLAMVGARTLAMTFNRVVDADLDAENPRTSSRALPTGRVKPWLAWLMVGASSALFGLAAVKLGHLPAKLAPFAFVVLLGYSFTKRFTVWSHAVLGLALSLAPLGAWIAISGKLQTPALWLAMGVLAWTFGFDIIYALQDRDFDKQKGLYSIPVELGIAPALMVSRVCHGLAIFSWMVFLKEMNVSFLPWLSLAIVAAILFREQWVVRGGNLGRIDHAFFTLNSFVGLVLFLGFFVDWLMFKIY